ncbi:nucleotidyltransferase domain-containing protein [Kribbella deserti]|uniref:Nucleotidyltransferase domain-containing protein n=1 Tax=Kribbella deserti TaxID=1926257 RepID=A0ABV6QI73_9ACTN
MSTAEADELLERFTRKVRQLVTVEAVWAHGSLALGDFQPHSSDLDLVVLLSGELNLSQWAEVRNLHKKLAKRSELAERLSCAYVDKALLADVERTHPTWTHGKGVEKPVTPVTRRELLVGGLTLYGREPAGIVPPVTDDELVAFIRSDLRDFWYPATDKKHIWQKDIWVDLGPLTVARAKVTLEEGRLITKGEAIDVMNTLAAPPALVDDICRRRYEVGPATSRKWRAERGELARRFVRAQIEKVLSLSSH